jgi:hypothetical protein
MHIGMSSNRPWTETKVKTSDYDVRIQMKPSNPTPEHQGLSLSIQPPQDPYKYATKSC